MRTSRICLGATRVLRWTGVGQVWNDISGSVVTGGGTRLGLAMATDVRLISSTARLMAGYTRIGGSPDAGLTITLPQVMGYEKAMRFMMENRTVTGAEALDWGMAGEVVDQAGFDARLAEYCASLCEWSPITLRLLKRGMVKSSESHDMEQQLRYEVSNIGRAFSRNAARCGIFICAWNAASKGGTSCGNSSRVRLVKSRNSVGRSCTSLHWKCAMGGASFHGRHSIS